VVCHDRAKSARAGTSLRALRWQALFRRSTDPIFVLDRRRRVLFVNPLGKAWPRPLSPPPRPCLSPFSAHGTGRFAEAILEHALTPPPEVLDGQTARVRRLLLGRESRRCWMWSSSAALGGATSGLLILGRITPVKEVAIVSAPLPESLIALREG